MNVSRGFVPRKGQTELPAETPPSPAQQGLSLINSGDAERSQPRAFWHESNPCEQVCLKA